MTPSSIPSTLAPLPEPLSRSTAAVQPTKKIILKLRINNPDLVSIPDNEPKNESFDDSSEQTIPFPSIEEPPAPTTTPKSNSRTRTRRRATPKAKPSANQTPKSTPARRPRAGRPRNISLLAAAQANAAAIREEFERQQEERARKLRSPSLSEFTSVSEYSFPMRLAPSRFTDAGTEPEIQDENGNGHENERLHTADIELRTCACCGVSVTTDTDTFTPTPQLHRTPCTPCQRQRQHQNPTAPNPHHRWLALNLAPHRHINTETGSVTDLVTLRSGPRPNTLAFWYDVTLGEIAKSSENIDLKMTCLNLIRTRTLYDDTEVVQGFRWKGHEGVVGSGGVGWDGVVSAAEAMGKVWRRVRRERDSERWKAAGWAVWERRERIRRSGEFVTVDDGLKGSAKGGWVLRAPGLDGRVVNVLFLGYKRVGRELDQIEAEEDGGDGDLTNVIEDRGQSECEVQVVEQAGEGQIESSAVFDVDVEDETEEDDVDDNATARELGAFYYGADTDMEDVGYISSDACRLDVDRIHFD